MVFVLSLKDTNERIQDAASAAEHRQFISTESQFRQFCKYELGPSSVNALLDHTDHTGQGNTPEIICLKIYTDSDVTGECVQMLYYG